MKGLYANFSGTWAELSARKTCQAVNIVWVESGYVENSETHEEGVDTVSVVSQRLQCATGWHRKTVEDTAGDV